MPCDKRFLGTALASAIMVAHPAASSAQSLFQGFHLGYNKDDAVGAPRSFDFMSRYLLEDGYELTAPIVRTGPVYIAKVVKRARPLCLVLDSFNGTILQTFAYTPAGALALNVDSPGPGYPGYPPFPDARYASACEMPHVVEVAPAPPPKRKIIHHIAPKRRPRVKHRVLPACGPYTAPAHSEAPPAKSEAPPAQFKAPPAKFKAPQKPPFGRTPSKADDAAPIRVSGICPKPPA